MAHHRSTVHTAIVAVTLLALAATAATAVTPAPAIADSGSTRDPRGEDPAGGDILRLQASESARVVRGTISLRALDADRVSTYLVIDSPGDSGFDFYLVGSRARGTSQRPVIARFDDGEPRMQRCEGLRVRLDRRAGQVRVVVPRSCLRETLGDLRVYALTETPRGAKDIDSTRPVVLRT